VTPKAGIKKKLMMYNAPYTFDSAPSRKRPHLYVCRQSVSIFKNGPGKTDAEKEKLTDTGF